MVSSLCQLIDKVTAENADVATKAFFGKYHYKANFELPGAKFMRLFSAAEDRKQFGYRVTEYLADKIEWYHSILFGNNTAGYYQVRKLSSDIKISVLWDIKEKLKARSIKFQSSTSQLTIYADTEQQLLDIVNDANLLPNLLSVAYPIEGYTLGENEEFVDNPKFKFRVDLREGAKKEFYDDAVRLLAYLDQMEEGMVHIGASLRRRMNSRVSWMSGQFYINDESIIPFVLMLGPNLIRRVVKLIPKPNK